MANRFKGIENTVEEKVEQPQPIERSKRIPKKGRSGLVKSLSAVFSGTFLESVIVLKHIPFVLFLSALAILYIANGYWADDKIRQMNKIGGELKELRSEYISSKSDLMFISKQSEVAKAVEYRGIKEPIVPPMKIVVSDTADRK
jgi:hypothetical protein